MSTGTLAGNILHFSRVLRAAGLPVGPGQVVEAQRAVAAVGVERREDVYWALHAVLVSRADQRDLFDEAFAIFWRLPGMMRLPSAAGPAATAGGAKPDPARRRIAEALMPGAAARARSAPVALEDEAAPDAAMTYSERERFRAMDFEDMSADELRAARAVIADLRLPVRDLPTRRFAPAAHGPVIDMRATLRASLRGGGGIIPLRRARRRHRPPPLVALCDISGSMSRYSRMMLHFLHAITNDRDRVHSFLFGTRLTNISRQLRHRDVDLALAKVAGSVQDWAGGTRIGACLHAFNQDWSRRVLGQGPVVLLITDGLDREAGHGLAAEMRRLHDSSRRLIWLNPLLRFAGFQPKSIGVRAMLPHVDDFRTVHNLDSLTALRDVLAQPAAPRTRTAPGRAA